MTTANFVDFQNVWLAYNDELLAQNHFAVEDINLQVKQGEFIAIVGPSGCGKSTFMKLTTGLKRPSKGQILVDGQPIAESVKTDDAFRFLRKYSSSSYSAVTGFYSLNQGATGLEQAMNDYLSE